MTDKTEANDVEFPDDEQFWRSSASHPLRMMLDRRYAKAITEAFRRCESPVEGDLLHCLLKGYFASDIQQQYKVGRYRIDFVTADGVGWELDGKKYHDKERDWLRDGWILQNSEIQQIIRVQAAALMFFRDACLAVIGHFVDHMADAKLYCDRDSARANEEADSWAEDECFLVYEYGIGEMLCSFEMGEAFEIVGDTGYVGSPYAFLIDDHELWQFVDRDRVNLNKWLGRITRRVR